MSKTDVFISRKSADAPYAKKIYEYLTEQGLAVFESDHTLKELGNAEYIKAIDEALVNATNMIVVGSSAENIMSPWVEAEWLFFLNRKRSGKASGNLLTVAAKTLPLEEVPPSLAYYEVIPYNVKNFPVIYNYVRQSGASAKPAPEKPFPAAQQNKWLWAVVGVLVAGILAFGIYFNSQPYDATVFLKPDPTTKLQSAYPSFKGGELSVFIDNKEERKQVLANGEVTYKTLAASSAGEKVAIKLHTKHWTTQTDSVVLAKVMYLNLIPDGSLGKLTGNIKTPEGKGIGNVLIRVGNDTTFTSNANGSFILSLPYSLQREFYVLEFLKDGFSPVKEYYYPKSGTIDVVMR